MAIVEFLIVTKDQRASLAALNSPRAAISPLPVTGENPGVAVNLSASATDHEQGVEIALAGKFVVPRHVIADPEYQRHAPDLVHILTLLPYAELDTGMIFALEGP